MVGEELLEGKPDNGEELKGEMLRYFLLLGDALAVEDEL